MKVIPFGTSPNQLQIIIIIDSVPHQLAFHLWNCKAFGISSNRTASCELLFAAAGRAHANPRNYYFSIPLLGSHEILCDRSSSRNPSWINIQHFTSIKCIHSSRTNAQQNVRNVFISSLISCVRLVRHFRSTIFHRDRLLSPFHNFKLHRQKASATMKTTIIKWKLQERSSW